MGTTGTNVIKRTGNVGIAKSRSVAPVMSRTGGIATRSAERN
jgi:hypothetical protein